MGKKQLLMAVILIPFISTNFCLANSSTSKAHSSRATKQDLSANITNEAEYAEWVRKREALMNSAKSKVSSRASSSEKNKNTHSN